jgi:hypothetical protein
MALLVMVFVSRGSAGVGRIAGGTELNITFGGSEVFEPLDDVFAGVRAAFTFRAGSGRCAAFDRFALERRVVDEVEQITETAGRIFSRPAVQLGPASSVP